MYQRCTAFSLVVLLFNCCTAFWKYIYEDHRICSALEKTVHFRTNIIANEINSQIQCTKDVQLFLWLYSFSIVVQLFENIYMRTTEFVQLWKKTVHFGTNTILNEIKSQIQCTKDVQLFALDVQVFENIHMRKPQNLYSFGKNCTFS